MKSIRIVGAGIAALALTAGLGACSANPGLGISINDTSYSVDEVDQTVADFQQMSPQAPTPAQVVTALVNSEALIKAGEQNNLTVTQQDVDAALKQARSENPNIPAQPSRGTMAILKQQLLTAQLQNSPEDVDKVGQTYQKDMADAAISVNPRYGLKWTGSGLAPNTAFGDVLPAGLAASSTK